MKKRNQKFVCNSIEELREAFHGITSIVSGDTRFMAQALLFLAERAVSQPSRPKRKPSAWQRFFANGMKQGKSPAQIATEWRQRKLKIAA